MVKNIEMVNTTMVGIMQSSNAGSPVVDGALNAMLLKQLKDGLGQAIVKTMTIKMVDVDELKVDSNNETLVLINNRVLKSTTVPAELLGNHYLTYDNEDLEKNSFENFIENVKKMLS